MKRRLFLVLGFAVLLVGGNGVGSKTVTAAGTAERLVSTTTRVSWWTVQALADNSGNVFVGTSAVEDGTGIELEPGKGHHFPVIAPNYKYDLYEWYVDSASNGDGVSWIYEVR